MSINISRHIAVSESGLIFNPETGEAFAANPIGIEILNLLKVEKPKDEILDFILTKYDIDKNQLEQDYLDFVLCLRKHQLIIMH